MKTSLMNGMTECPARVGAPRALTVVALMATGVGVLTAGSWLSVPFYPVPLTLQTLAVLLVGGLLGPTLGASTVAAYLAIGALGAPVFHNGLGGLAVLFGPTGGYLVGFLPAAFLMGVASRRVLKGVPGHGGSSRPAAVSGRAASLRDTLALAAGALAAGAVVYAVGVPWLSLFTGAGLRQAAALGAVPFLLGDLLKVAVVVPAVRLGRAALSRRQLPLF